MRRSKEEGVIFKVMIDVLEAKCVCGAARFESTATGNSNCHSAREQSTSGGSCGSKRVMLSTNFCLFQSLLPASTPHETLQLQCRLD